MRFLNFGGIVLQYYVGIMDAYFLDCGCVLLDNVWEPCTRHTCASRWCGLLGLAGDFNFHEECLAYCDARFRLVIGLRDWAWGLPHSILDLEAEMGMMLLVSLMAVHWVLGDTADDEDDAGCTAQ